MDCQRQKCFWLSRVLCCSNFKHFQSLKRRRKYYWIYSDWDRLHQFFLRNGNVQGEDWDHWLTTDEIKLKNMVVSDDICFIFTVPRASSIITLFNVRWKSNGFFIPNLLNSASVSEAFMEEKTPSRRRKNSIKNPFSNSTQKMVS